MQMTERERQFLELAEEFQQDYCLLRDEVVNTQFLDLSDDLYEKVHALYEKAQQIYGYISSTRQIGNYYLLACLSYFASPDTSNTQNFNVSTLSDSASKFFNLSTLPRFFKNS